MLYLSDRARYLPGPTYYINPDGNFIKGLTYQLEKIVIALSCEKARCSHNIHFLPGFCFRSHRAVTLLHGQAGGSGYLASFAVGQMFFLRHEEEGR